MEMKLFLSLFVNFKISFSNVHTYKKKCITSMIINLLTKITKVGKIITSDKCTRSNLLRLKWGSTQSDQSLRCLPEYTAVSLLRI